MGCQSSRNRSTTDVVAVPSLAPQVHFEDEHDVYLEAKFVLSGPGPSTHRGQKLVIFDVWHNRIPLLRLVYDSTIERRFEVPKLYLGRLDRFHKVIAQFFGDDFAHTYTMKLLSKTYTHKLAFGHVDLDVTYSALVPARDRSPLDAAVAVPEGKVYANFVIPGIAAVPPKEERMAERIDLERAPNLC